MTEIFPRWGRPVVIPVDETGAALGRPENPLAVRGACAPVQGYVAVPPFNAADPGEAGGINATAVLVLAANANRRYLRIVNNGGADVELWTGARPAAAQVAQNPRRGEWLAAGGGGLVEDSVVRTSALYATAAAASGLLVLEG